MIGKALLKEFAGPIATVIAASTAAFVAIVFGAVQALIARSQAKTAEAQKQIAKAQLDIAYDRLKQDFFEKRYEIYVAAKKLIEAATEQTQVINPLDPEIQKLRRKLDEARFFFPQDTREFCEEIGRVASKVLVASYLADIKPEDIRPEDEQLREEAELALFDFLGDLAKRFERDLSLEQLTRKTEINLPDA
jgi:hypothetical protein